MGLRKGEFVGFWSPEWLKRALEKSGEQQHRSLSQEAIHRLEGTFTEEEKREAKERAQKVEVLS